MSITIVSNRRNDKFISKLELIDLFYVDRTYKISNRIAILNCKLSTDELMNLKSYLYGSVDLSIPNGVLPSNYYMSSVKFHTYDLGATTELVMSFDIGLKVPLEIMDAITPRIFVEGIARNLSEKVYEIADSYLNRVGGKLVMSINDFRVRTFSLIEDAQYKNQSVDLAVLDSFDLDNSMTIMMKIVPKDIDRSDVNNYYTELINRICRISVN